MKDLEFLFDIRNNDAFLFDTEIKILSYMSSTRVFSFLFDISVSLNCWDSVWERDMYLLSLSQFASAAV